jgi:hypothetical protein
MEVPAAANCNTDEDRQHIVCVRCGNCCLLYAVSKCQKKVYTIECSYCALLDAVEITNTMHRLAPLLYSTCWLLHVSAVVCHLQEASESI